MNGRSDRATLARIRKICLSLPETSIDQVQLREFDYIDIGRPLPAQHVVPVVVKSLIFH